MSKKARTPTPPRPVQAPRKRRDPKGPSRFSERRGTWLLVGVAVLALIAAAVLAVVLTRGGGSSTGAFVPDQSKLAGLQTGPAPWNPGLDTLPDRLDAVGVNDLTTEGQVLHIHQHLDVFVNGKREPVPQGVGVYDGQFLTELHTHDARGIIHVESPVAKHFDLGQFFGVWGVRLNQRCIGGYCDPLTPWTVYVNGQPYTGDPAELVLREHQEIAFVIGTPPKRIPSTYKFPAGL